MYSIRVGYGSIVLVLYCRDGVTHCCAITTCTPINGDHVGTQGVCVEPSNEPKTVTPTARSMASEAVS